MGNAEKTVAVLSGGVHLDVRGVRDLVDTVRCWIDSGSQSMVDRAGLSYGRGRVIRLYGFMYASPLC